MELSRNQNKNVIKERNAERDGELITSDVGAFLHMVKSSLGSGLLAMPHAFSNSGLLMGSVSVLLVAAIATYSSKILVRSSQHLSYMQGKKSLTYTETVEAAFIIGAKGRFEKWSGTMRVVTDFISFITYFGTNIVYIILIASTLKQVVDSNLGYNVDLRLLAVVLTPVLIPVGLVRHMKLLVPFSFIANVLLLFSCLLTLYYCFNDMPPLSARPLVVSLTRWPLCFCTALFGMEGIGTVLPISNSMRNPSHFLGSLGVLNLSMVVVGVTFLVMGFVGFMKYGEEVLGTITLNLPKNTLCDAVKTSVAIAILLTYPLQLTVSIEVVWRRVSPWFSDNKQTFGHYLSRTLVIIGTVLLAAGVPQLSSVIALVGALGFSGMGLLLPTITDMVTFWDSLGPGLLAKHLVMLLLWAVASVSGAFISLNQIYDQFNL